MTLMNALVTHVCMEGRALMVRACSPAVANLIIQEHGVTLVSSVNDSFA